MTDLNFGLILGFIAYPIFKWLTIAIWGKICEECEPASIEEDI